MRDAGCSFTLEVTPSDELMPFINEMNKKAIEEVGALPHITIARDERDPEKLPILTDLNKDEYYKFWSKFESAIFDYKMKIFEVKRTEFCYAGDWSFYLNLGTGIMTQCYKTLTYQNIFEDIKKPINFCPIGNNCLEYHCYNGHSYIVLGDIPELDAPTYAELRNRICSDGNEWLTPEMKSFMSSKLYESNKEYTEHEKEVINKKLRKLVIQREIKGKIGNSVKEFLKYIKK